MSTPGGEGWLDGDAARVVRPYAVTGGRTSPRVELDLMSMIVATGSGTGSHLEPDHEHALSLCRQPASVAEIAARLRLPAVAAKVVLSDLAGWGAVRASVRVPASGPDSQLLLERVLDGLLRL
jgi:hypothetical protein